MKTNKTKLTAAALICSLAVSVSACAQNPPQTSTTAAQTTPAETTTTTSAETTTTAETTTAPETTTSEIADEVPKDDPSSQPVYDTNREKHPFRLGVWVAKGEAGSEYYDETYYCFRENGMGSFLSQSMGIGMAFGYEADGDSKTKYRFEIGAVDNFSYLEIVDVGLDDDHFKAKWDGYDTIEDWSYLCSADEFSFYSNYSIGLMAKTLYGMGQYSISDPIVETGFELGMISVVIRDPSIEDYTKSILKWYNIDRYTAKGHEVNSGDPVDLTVLEDGWEDMPYPDRFAISPDLKQRHELSTDGSMFGIWFFGAIDPSLNAIYDYETNTDNREKFNDIFRKVGVMNDLRLLKTFPGDRFVTTGDGQELYFILPADEHGSLSVTKLLFSDDGTLSEGEVLYSTDDSCYPILLKCNVSEIYPDVVIKMTDSTGRYVEWSPYISGENGRIVTANDSGAPIRDFTNYKALIAPTESQNNRILF